MAKRARAQADPDVKADGRGTTKKRPPPKVGPPAGQQVLSKYFGATKPKPGTASPATAPANQSLPERPIVKAEQPPAKAKQEASEAVLSLVSDSEDDFDESNHAVDVDEIPAKSPPSKRSADNTLPAPTAIQSSPVASLSSKSAEKGSSESPSKLAAARNPSRGVSERPSTLAERLAALDATTTLPDGPDDNGGGGGNDDDGDNDDEEMGSGPDAKGKLTPLEKQWKALKDEYPDVLLCVECGYKYRMFGDDAKVAADVLSIAAFPRHAFLTASFPVHRLHVHVRRLVEAGHLVGIVTQTETAALKKQSATKSKIFTREMTALYSRATLLPDAMLDVAPQPSSAAAAAASAKTAAAGASRKGGLFRAGWARKGESAAQSEMDANQNSGDEDQDATQVENALATVETFADEEAERYIVAIWELDAASGNPVLDASEGWALGEPRPEAEAVILGLFAVDVQSGALVCESFSDDHARTTLAERLERLDAYEYVLGGPTMSRGTEDVILRTAQPAQRGRRIDRVGFTDLNVDRELCKVYTGQPLAAAKSLAPPAQAALACLIRYLEPFKLQRVLRDLSAISGRVQQNSVTTMQLDPGALHDLEIVPGKAGPKYSLVYFVTRHAQTPMGSRLLKRWVMQPLADAPQICARQAAVEALGLARADLAPLMKALRLLKRFDMERSLEQVVHARCSPANFLRLVDNARDVAQAVAAVADKIVDPLLAEILRDSDASRLSEALGNLERGLHRQSCESNTIGDMFIDRAAYPRIFEVKSEIQGLHEAFDRELAHIRQVLKKPDLKYRTLRTGISASLEYLVELPKAQAVPREWTEVSSTQRVSRYTSPKVEELLDQLARRREELAAVAKTTWRQLLENFADEHRRRLRGLARAVAHVDAFSALSKISQLPGFARPRVEAAGPNGGAFVHALRARHPLLDLLAASNTCVPNDIALGDAPDDTPDMARVLLVTGPNMGGKSSFTRTAAVCVIMAQIGAHVPAEVCRIGVFDGIRVRMGVREDPTQGMSTFMVEMKQAASIFNLATPRTLCILDELGRGTSTFDGTAIALASLRYLCATMRSPTLFITHYTQLGALLDEFPRNVLAAMHMAFHETEDNKIVFLYQATAGLAANSYGLHVAQLAGIPDRVLSAARKIKEDRHDAHDHD